jgi:GGDEF domain-containing protein
MSRLTVTVFLVLSIPLLGEADHASRPDFGFSLLYLSVGVACFREPPEDADVTLGAADRALYQAKGQGKGRIVLTRG